MASLKTMQSIYAHNLNAWRKAAISISFSAKTKNHSQQLVSVPTKQTCMKLTSYMHCCDQNYMHTYKQKREVYRPTEKNSSLVDVCLCSYEYDYTYTYIRVTQKAVQHSKCAYALAHTWM